MLESLERLDREIAEHLQAAQARLVAAEAEVQAAKRNRADAIDGAMKARWTQTRIGAQLGVTKQRVQQIRRARETGGL